MKETHSQWRALWLTVPVHGKNDSWFRGMKTFEFEAYLREQLQPESGLSGSGPASNRISRDGTLVELTYHFWYEDLSKAVLAFKEIWTAVAFPDRTLLTHVERFPDGTFEHHVLIRWIDGRMDPFSTVLSDEVKLGPHNS